MLRLIRHRAVWRVHHASSVTPCARNSGASVPSRFYSDKNHPQWEISRARNVGEGTIEAVDASQWQRMMDMDYDELVLSHPSLALDLAPLIE